MTFGAVVLLSFGPMGNKRSTNKEKTAEQRAMALRLRKDGHSYSAIGRMLGTQFRNQQDPDGSFTSVYASKLVHEAIRDIYREDSKSLVSIEMERLDDMQLECLTVLRTHHLTIDRGEVVYVPIKDEHGEFLLDAVSGLPIRAPLEDDGPKLAAIDRLLKIQERRSRLLGLDKPTKVAPTNPEGDKPAPAYIIMATPEDQKL